MKYNIENLNDDIILAHLDRSLEQLERGEVVVKSMEELEHMANE